eukprot:scaffold48217_cov36-Phaeocystis_antarctica.AAC.1
MEPRRGRAGARLDAHHQPRRGDPHAAPPVQRALLVGGALRRARRLDLAGRLRGLPTGLGLG